VRLSCVPHRAIPQWMVLGGLVMEFPGSLASCQGARSRAALRVWHSLRSVALWPFCCVVHRPSRESTMERSCLQPGAHFVPGPTPSGTWRYGIVSRVGQCCPSFGCRCWPLSGHGVRAKLCIGRCLRCHLFCDLRHRELPAEFKHITWQRKRQQLRWLQ